MVEVILERRRRRAEAAGEPYEDPPLKSLFDAHGRPQTLAEVLRRAGKRARERDLGQVQSTALSEKVVWQLFQGYTASAGVPGIAPHDLRRTCAKLCRAA